MVISPLHCPVNTVFLTFGAHALAMVTVVVLCVCVCVSVCLSGLNLASRVLVIRYYTYVFFTMNAMFSMCGVR